MTRRIDTLLIKALPQQLCRGPLDITGRQGGHLSITKQYVTMQIAARVRLYARPLITDKTGEAAILTAVVVGLRCLLHLLPGHQCRLEAELPALTALAQM